MQAYMRANLGTFLRAARVAVAALVVLGGGGADARPSAYVSCNFGNWYAHQSTDKAYKGIFGWLKTFQPYVPNLNLYFSVSHLYAHANYGPFVEVGWYRGLGTEIISTQTNYYSAMQDSVTPYTEHDYAQAPAFVFLAYEVQYEGFDYAVNKYKWGAYANNLSSPLYVWRNKDLASGRALSGGEASRASNIHMLTDMDPNHQVKTSDNVWHNWDQTFMGQQADVTRTCDDPGFTIAYTHQFDNYQANGSGP